MSGSFKRIAIVYARGGMAADVVEVDILRGNRIRRESEESDEAVFQALEFLRLESSLKFRMGREPSLAVFKGGRALLL